MRESAATPFSLQPWAAAIAAAPPRREPGDSNLCGVDAIGQKIANGSTSCKHPVNDEWKVAGADHGVARVEGHRNDESMAGHRFMQGKLGETHIIGTRDRAAVVVNDQGEPPWRHLGVMHGAERRSQHIGTCRSENRVLRRSLNYGERGVKDLNGRHASASHRRGELRFADVERAVQSWRCQRLCDRQSRWDKDGKNGKQLNEAVTQFTSDAKQPIVRSWKYDRLQRPH